MNAWLTVGFFTPRVASTQHHTGTAGQPSCSAGAQSSQHWLCFMIRLPCPCLKCEPSDGYLAAHPYILSTSQVCRKMKNPLLLLLLLASGGLLGELCSGLSIQAAKWLSVA